MMTEIWKKIPEFESYEISNMGRLKLKIAFDDVSNPRVKCKHGRISSSNSGNVCLRKNNKNHWFKRSQLVLLAFKGAPASKIEWNARHLDDNQAHNWLDNLAWGTAKDNHNDAIKNGKHAAKGSMEALKYATALKGVPRSEEVKRKISQTKQAHPERVYKGKQGSGGRFVS